MQEEYFYSSYDSGISSPKKVLQGWIDLTAGGVCIPATIHVLEYPYSDHPSAYATYAFRVTISGRDSLYESYLFVPENNETPISILH